MVEKEISKWWKAKIPMGNEIYNFETARVFQGGIGVLAQGGILDYQGPPWPTACLSVRG